MGSFFNNLFGKGNSYPPAPDYGAMAAAQGAANAEAARISGRINNPNFNTPLGRRRITWQGDRPTITDTLTPQGQQLFGMQNRLATDLGGMAINSLGDVRESFNQPFDMSQVRDRAIAPQATEQGREAVIQAMLKRMQPMLDRQRTQSEQALLQQGHNVGGDAWRAGQETANMRENDARLAAILAGGQEQSRLFGLNQARYGMESQGRQQDIQEQAYLRMLPLTELNALRSGNAPTMPQFQAYTGQPVGAAPIMQAGTLQTQYALGQANAEAAQQNAAKQMLGSIGGGFMGNPSLSRMFG